MSIQQTDCSVQRLIAWPDIPQMKPEHVADMARICALLAYRPTAGGLIPRMLDISPIQVQAVLERLRELGCLNTSVMRMEEVPMPNEPVPATAPVSVLAKIWNRLAGAGRNHVGGARWS